MTSFSVSLSVEERGRKRPEYTLDSDISGEITLMDLLEWTKSALIVTADKVLKEEQARGFDKNPVLTVDGRRDKPIEKVHPLGKIQFTARQNYSDIIKEAYFEIYRRSPVKTGRYRDSHYVFLNGNQVAKDMGSLEKWLRSNPDFKNNDVVRIVNIQPYGRRLELLGVTAQRTQSKKEDSGRRNKRKTGTKIKVPNGTYQLTTRAIRAKYKNNLGVRFTFLPGSSLGLAGTFKGGRKGKNSAGRSYLYPTMVLTMNERGLK